MDTQDKKEEVRNPLNSQEEEEMRAGQEIYEMTQTAGWKRVVKLLEDLGYHSWVDPREIEGPEAEKEWKWRELNAFHAMNNARELLEKINRAVSDSEYLSKVKAGEIQRKSLKI